jgi:enoyl-CoA hydratase/carnithine racemase
VNHQLLLMQRRDNVCTLTLNRPQKKNSPEMALEIAGNAPLAVKGIKRISHMLMQASRLDKNQSN